MSNIIYSESKQKLPKNIEVDNSLLLTFLLVLLFPENTGEY